MKPHITLWSIVVMLVVVFALTASAQARNGTSQAVGGPPGPSDSDSNPTHRPEVNVPAIYQPTATELAATAAIPSTAVYFTPQDENTSTTVLFLYNTNSETSTVGLQTFYINGSLTISTTVAVPPLGLVRICADTVNTVSASWANSVLINFTTFSAYAKMTVPSGVKADGYVAWDSTGIYDPLVVSQTLPLRFSTDPASVFLPTLQNSAP